MFCCYAILDCLTLEKISCLDQVNLFVREGMRLQHIFISASEVPKQQKDSITVFISTPRPNFTNCLQVLMLETSHQTTSKAGTQSYSSANWLPKVILSSQTPQNTPPDAALPIRWKRLGSTHQSLDTSLHHEEA